MEYNTTRNNLVISEYGRNIQKMIEYTMTMGDRVKRTKSAYLIVDVMAQMHPHVKDTVDFKQKLWDHLHMISGFKLDVDSPFPVPTKKALESKPERLGYQENNIKFRQYGKNLQRVIDKVIEMEDGEEKNTYIKSVANHLKKSYLNWNRDSVNDDLIYEHLKILSDGKLEMPENSRLLNTGDILSRGSSTGSGSGSSSGSGSYQKKKKPFGKKGKDKNGYHKKYSSY